MEEIPHPAQPCLRDPSNSLKFVQNIYIDATNTIRHYDVQRTAFVGLLTASLTATTAALRAMTQNQVPIRIVVSCWIFLAVLLLVFLLATQKLNLLIDQQRHRAREAIRLHELYSGDTVLSDIDQAARKAASHRTFSSLRLSTLWLTVFILLIMANAGLAIAALKGFLP
jgi:hypothetical protein